MLTAAQKQQLKHTLLNEQSKLIQKVQSNFQVETSFIQAVGDLSSYDNHPADSGTEMYEREKDITLKDHAEQELEKINEALHALEDGTYGIRSEEHTSELQSRGHLVCRLLLEKYKKTAIKIVSPVHIRDLN